MALQEQINDDLKTAMRARDATRIGALRLLKTDIRNLEVARTDRGKESSPNPDFGKPITDEDVHRLVRKRLQMYRESAEMYHKGNRPEQAAREEAEAEILAAYLPRQLTRDEVSTHIQKIVAQHGKNFPVVIKQAMTDLRSNADGRTINEVARELTA